MDVFQKEKKALVLVFQVFHSGRSFLWRICREEETQRGQRVEAQSTWCSAWQRDRLGFANKFAAWLRCICLGKLSTLRQCTAYIRLSTYDTICSYNNAEGVNQRHFVCWFQDCFPFFSTTLFSCDKNLILAGVSELKMVTFESRQ